MLLQSCYSQNKFLSKFALKSRLVEKKVKDTARNLELFSMACDEEREIINTEQLDTGSDVFKNHLDHKLF